MRPVMVQKKSQEIQPAKFFNGHRSNILHIFMYLADKNEPINGKVLAKELDISIGGFEKLARFMQKSELLATSYGPLGGYQLIGAPKDITLLDMLGFTILPNEEPHGVHEVMLRITDYYDTITLQNLIDWNK